MYECEKCDRKFATRHALGGHQRVHSTKPRSGIEVQKMILRSKAKREANIQLYAANPKFCTNCNAVISYDTANARKRDRSYKTYKNLFCNKSCAATYNNTHKTHGTRRSKLENWLEIKLSELFPGIVIHFNKKDAIDSELDIYIPSLNLAFELNGIYHYEPIHGAKLLSNIQNNDKRKFQACLERDIELCIIDSSKLVYFKESNAVPYLNIITDIINTKMVENSGIEPLTFCLQSRHSTN